jgi:hypothetical protein
MSHNTIFPSIRILSAATALLGACAAFAQQPAAAPKPIDWTKAVPETSFKGRRVNQDSSWTARTPKIYGNAQAKEQIWGVFEYSFETKALWTDNLTATFHVMLDAIDVIKNSKGQIPEDTPRFSYMTLTLRYSDIPKGRDHKICAILPPAALERFGKPIGIGVEVAVGDTAVYTDDKNISPVLVAPLQKLAQANPGGKLPKWWEYINANAMIQSKMARRNDYLVDRSKTPFAVVAIDDYLQSK